MNTLTINIIDRSSFGLIALTHGLFMWMALLRRELTLSMLKEVICELVAFVLMGSGKLL